MSLGSKMKILRRYLERRIDYITPVAIFSKIGIRAESIDSWTNGMSEASRRDKIRGSTKDIFESAVRAEE